MKKMLLFVFLFLSITLTVSQSVGSKYVQEKIYIKTGNEYLCKFNYYNAFGEIRQSVQAGVTPQGSDLVRLETLDKLDRITHHWLPVPISGNGGRYVSDFYRHAYAAAIYSSDTRPYVETRYGVNERRELQPGAAWAAHPAVVRQESNARLEVKHFYGTAQGSLQYGGYYPQDSLYKTVFTDEDGKTITEYTDKLGQVVMHRRRYLLRVQRFGTEVVRTSTAGGRCQRQRQRC